MSGRVWVGLPRLLLALVSSALVMAAISTLIAYFFFGRWGGDAAMVRSDAETFGMIMLSALLVFSLTFGLAAMLALRWVGKTGAIAHALVGALAGVAFSGAATLISGQPFDFILPITLAIVGAVMLLMARFIVGSRRDSVAE